MIHKRSTPTGKPQLHTSKNHDTYNGVHHLPIATHVCVPATTTNNNNQPHGSSQQEQQRPCSITLFYEHNRACEIYRSLDEFSNLSRALVAASYPEMQLSPPGKLKPQGDIAGNGANGEGSSRGLNSPATYPTGSSPGSCCGCGTTGTEEDAQLRLDLNVFLERVIRMARREPAQDGTTPPALAQPAVVALEWFLRRRDGDCGGR
ncbi:PX domain-containing protein [Madurella fahalii]|uniref:PX domain-containing protein n=1 Tax=Madurella fahalii TaxID=1157608 RepID=A0ABQ0FYJ8_9PEZI